MTSPGVERRDGYLLTHSGSLTSKDSQALSSST